MKDKEDVEVFLAAFEGHMTSHGVSLENWAKHLLPTLPGDAMSTYIRMSADQRGDYKKIKGKLLTKYQSQKKLTEEGLTNLTEKKGKNGLSVETSTTFI